MTIIETNWHWNTGLSNRARTDYIALHHAAAVKCTAADIDSWHKSNGWSGIGYHFFVRKDGSIYRGRPINKMGSHVLHRNNESIGVCAEGNYDKEQTMPAAQKASIKELLRYLKGIYPLAKIVGHREIGSSDCPGKYYPLEEMKTTYQNKEGLTVTQYEELKTSIVALGTKLDEAIARIDAKIEEKTTPMVYDYIDNNMPEWAKEGVRYCVEHGIIQGTGDGRLGLDDKDLKLCTMLMRIFELRS